MTFHLVQMRGCPIYDQLVLEEGLLWHDERNFCLINIGSPPAVVMGFSGKKEELVHLEKLGKVPLIQRFSGGGTVVVGAGTVFITFVGGRELHPFPIYPERLMEWSASIYNAASPQITLRENDYVIGEKKCGGNAQYIRKNRWLHHTSFLWDYEEEHMALLRHPKKAPPYREGRAHRDFVTKLSHHFASKEEWLEGIKAELGRRYRVEVLSSEAELRALIPVNVRTVLERNSYGVQSIAAITSCVKAPAVSRS